LVSRSLVCTAMPKLQRFTGRQLEQRQNARASIRTPQSPFQSILPAEGEFLAERFDPSHGDWLNTSPGLLEKLGKLPHCYVKYCAFFEHHGEQNLAIETTEMESMLRGFQPRRSQYRVRWTDGQSKERTCSRYPTKPSAAKRERRDVGTEGHQCHSHRR